MPLKNLEDKSCLLKLKIPEVDINTFGSALPVKFKTDFYKFNNGSYGFVLSCQLLEYDLNGIWIYFHSEVDLEGMQEQELFVPIRYVISIQLYSGQTYKDAKIKPKIGFENDEQ